MCFIMPSLFSFLISVTRPFTRYIVGLLIVAIGWSMVVNIQPYIIKLIIDAVVWHKGSLNPQDLTKDLFPLIATYTAVGVGFIILFRYYDFIIVHFVPKQKEFIALKLMRRMMSHSTTFFQRHFAGNLTNKVNDVTLHTPELIKIITDNFATCLCTLVFVLYNVALVHVKFAWALLAWLVIFVTGSLWLLFRNNSLAGNSAEARSQVSGHIIDMLTNMTSIRLFVRPRYEEKLLKKVTGNAIEHEQARDRFFMKLHFFQGVSFWVFEAVCFWWLLKGVSSGSITPGGFVLVFTLNLQMLDKFWNLGSEIREFWEKLGHLKQAINVIYVHDDLPQLPHARSLNVTKGDIIFDNVHFFYEGSPPFFEDKTIEIYGKQKVGLVGYSGSGKTTFVSLILRLYDVTSGRILIDGQDIQEVSISSLCESIAVIPQDCPLFNRTLMENIRYGNLDASTEEVYEAAKKAQIHDIIQCLPHGYQTFAGEKGMRLSGGQRQRIYIARAILKNAPILILDEATSHLDTITEEKLKYAIDELVKDKTLLLIAHRLSTLTTLDRILVFDNGKIVQDGTHRELSQIPGLYHDLWETQSDGMLKFK